MTVAGETSKPNAAPRGPRTWPRKALATVALLGAMGTLWIKSFVLDVTPEDASARSISPAGVEPIRDATDLNAASAATRASQPDEWSNKPVVAMRRNLFAISTIAAAADSDTRQMARPTPMPPLVQVVQVPQPLPQPLQTPATQASAPSAPQPQVIVVMPPTAQVSTTSDGIQHGLSRNSRQQLAQAAYQDALDELSATDPDLNTALWHLDSAINFNPEYTEAIELHAKINGQLVAQSSGSVVDGFLRRQMVAGQTTRPSGGQQ
jgi:hypothetical protein